MSKQAIQAAKQRKRWLLLPAFLAMALVVFGGNWLASGTAKANVTAADFVVLGPYPTQAAAQAGGAVEAGPLVGGSDHFWRARGTLTQPAAGALTMRVTFDAPLTVVSFAPTTGPLPSCSSTTSSVTCTYPANMSTGTVFDVIIATDVGNDGVSIAAGAVDVFADDASAQLEQGPTEGTVSAPLLLVAVDAGAVTEDQVTAAKSNIQSPAGMVTGDTGTFTITLTNNGPQTDVVASFTDTIPANLQLDNITFNDGTGQCSTAGFGGAPLVLPLVTPLAPGTTIFCWGIQLNDDGTPPDDTDTIDLDYTVVDWDADDEALTCGVGSGLEVRTNTVTATFDGEDPNTTPDDTDTATADANLACLGAGGAGDLVHLTPGADSVTLPGVQDVNNNLVGWVHKICAVNLIVDGVWPTKGADTVVDPVSGQAVPATLMFKVINANQVGNPNTTAIQASPLVDCDNDGAADDSLLTWYSTEPGDQFITIVDDGGSTVFDFNGPVLPGDLDIDPLIKEWNILVPTLILAGTAEGTANLDGTAISSSVFFDQRNGNFLSFTGKTVFEHVHGTHIDRDGSIFNDDVIGALVTFTVSGTCGVAEIGGAGQALEVPALTSLTDSVIVSAGDSVQLVTVGVPIEITVFAEGCLQGNGDFTLVTISTELFNPVGSTQPTIPDETIRVNFTLAPPANKQPLLAWAGQRVVLEHNWVEPDGFCPWNEVWGIDELAGFFVRYVKQNGPGSFIGALVNNGAGFGPLVDGAQIQITFGTEARTIFEAGGVIDATAAEAEVFVFSEDILRGLPAQDDGFDEFFDQDGLSNVFANGDCVSRVLYESQDQGEVDISSFVIFPQSDFLDDLFGGGFDFSNAAPISQQVPFLIYYMQLESLTLGRVAGEFDGHNNGTDPLGRFSNSNPWDNATDTTSGSSNVSADVLLRARVKGWFTTSVPTGRPAVAGTATTTGLPAGRWVMPDDWELLAGGSLAETFRPNYDIMFAPDSGFACSMADGADIGTGVDVDPQNCLAEVAQGAAAAATASATHANVQGPFSLLDTPTTDLGPGDIFMGGTDPVGSLAPFNPAVNAEEQFVFRNTILPDGDVDLWDAPMPPALIHFNLSGSGFINGAPKANVYSVGTNPFYASNIPAEPWIPMLNSDGEGYLINSWAAGAPYSFWGELPVAASAVFSAAGADSAKTTSSSAKVATGGFTNVAVYSDNHGEAMAIVNGDAGLTMAQCDTASNAANGIVAISGVFCEQGDLVGSSTVSAVADYPDKRKFAPIASNSVTIDWTWGGIKRVDIVAAEDEQFAFIVFTVTDRDDMCIPSTSLHPVLGELVEFIIDAGDGIIIDTSDGPALGALEADLHVVDTIDDPIGDFGDCQAWIKVSNSLLGQLNILIIAHDPEGTVTFDRIVDFTSTATFNLTFRWSLVTWTGANNIPVDDALSGTGANAGGSNIKARVTAVYGWNQAAQDWMAWFPNVGVPGAVDLVSLTNGAAYWVAISGNPGDTLEWTWKTSVN